MAGEYAIRPDKADGSKRYSRTLLYYSIYSLLFILTAFLVFHFFTDLDKTLIWKSDGYNQHYKALMYYGRYLREIARNVIVSHRLVIPEWDFFIGEGADVLNALHYYGIGDPLALSAAVVPSDHIHELYQFLILFRMYLAGIAFSMLARGTGRHGNSAVLAGALSYDFTAWALHAAATHPFFIDPMILFPLMILGIEKIIKGERPYLFIGISAVSAVCNFYYFYMIVLLSVAYALIRLILLYCKEMKRFCSTLLKMGLYAVIGVCIPGTAFLPILIMFMGDSRNSVAEGLSLLYPATYYAELPLMLFSSNTEYWLFMGWSAAATLAAAVMFIKHEKRTRLLRVLAASCIAVLLLPAMAKLLNGMSYTANRWCWAMALLVCFVLTDQWDDMFRLSEKQWGAASVFCICLFLLTIFLDESQSMAVFSGAALLLVTLILIHFKGNELAISCSKVMLIGIVIIGIANLGFWRFSPSVSSSMSEFVDKSDFMSNLYSTEGYVLKKTVDDDYIRYSGADISVNTNLLSKTSSTQYYWTLANPHMSSFRADMEMRERSLFSYKGYDGRSTINSLSSVKYYVSRNKGTPMYGCELYTSKGRLNIFRNRLAAPLGYSYDKCITGEAWSGMDPVQKQQAMLDGVFLGGSAEGMDTVEPEADYEVPIKIRCTDPEITYDKQTFITTKDNRKARIVFEGRPDCETYIRIKDISFRPTLHREKYSDRKEFDPGDLYGKAEWDSLSAEKKAMYEYKDRHRRPEREMVFNIEAGSKRKGIVHRFPGANFYEGRDDYIANLGYSEEPLSKAVITLPKRGRYSMEITVFCVPVKELEEKVEKLSRHPLKKVRMGTDMISGTIDAEQSRVLCIAVPYSDGWSAEIDGSPAEVMPANERYIGVKIPEGKHEIQLRYRRPGEIPGIILTIAGIIALFVVIVFTEKNNRKKRII